MTTYQKALEMLLDTVKVMESEEKPLCKCRGQVAAEDMYSELSLPLAAQSAPDGYAVKSQDIESANADNPVTLQIIETARAGHLPRKVVAHGRAIRIMTGSILPEGADCVVRFEDTDEPPGKSGPNRSHPRRVKIFKACVKCENVVPAGAYVKKGEMVIPKGTVIGPAQISVLAAIGREKVKVFRRPVIAIIATGDELVQPGKPLTCGKTYNCNAGALAALVTHYGGIPKLLGIAKDNERSLTAKIRKGMNMDAIITSGGVSMGDYDLVRGVISKLGQIIFSRIDIGPGGSMSFGKIAGTEADGCAVPVPVLALAGPPTGCLINFETIVRPALFKMMGINGISHPIIRAVARDSALLKRPMNFVSWSRLEKVDGDYQVDINASRGIGSLSAIATANSFTMIPKGTVVNPGDTVSVLPLDWTVNAQQF